MQPDAVERRLTAILSADVVGYSRLMAQDEVATVRTLSAYREEMAMLIRQHRGRVVDAPGDNLLAEFPSALDAVEAALEVQGVIQARNAAVPSERKMEFRIGVHLGDVMVEGERIYGDGVNVAARLERLAEPGGICISDMVHKQVRGKLELGYEDLGEQTVKNIPEPVRIFRLRPALGDEGARGGTESMPGADRLTVPGFSGRPAIAVLPFDNLSRDPEQEYFADGIAEDLITSLSSWRVFPVIARNSSFVYKGKPIDVKQVSHELGVRYVVEGSVRRAGERVRISAQLIDATTGHHVWAQRYDRELRDIFALQDEISEAIVVSIHPELLRFEEERALRQEPQNLDAWECAQRGFWHMNQLTKEDNAKARSLFEKAVELDPRFVLAFNGLARAHAFDLVLQWTDSPPRTIAEIIRAADRCIALDEKDPFSQVAAGTAYMMKGERDKALAALDRAVELNPSLPFAYFLGGLYLAFSGRGDEALPRLEKAMRLSPQDPMTYAFFSATGAAHFAAGRYEETVEWARRSLQRRPDWLIAYALLAISSAHLGRIEEACEASREMLRLQPELSLSGFRLLLGNAAPEYAEPFLEGLRKAGLK